MKVLWKTLVLVALVLGLGGKPSEANPFTLDSLTFPLGSVTAHVDNVALVVHTDSHVGLMSAEVSPDFFGQSSILVLCVDLLHSYDNGVGHNVVPAGSIFPSNVVSALTSLFVNAHPVTAIQSAAMQLVAWQIYAPGTVLSPDSHSTSATIASVNAQAGIYTTLLASWTVPAGTSAYLFDPFDVQSQNMFTVVTQVPEPRTILLFLGAIALLFFLVRYTRTSPRSAQTDTPLPHGGGFLILLLAILNRMHNHVVSHGRHMHISYAHSWTQRLYSHALVPLVAIIVSALFIHTFSATVPTQTLTATYIFEALAATFLRLSVAYCVSLLIAIPLALAVTHNKLAERIFLPFFDIMQSLPVLAFFPVIIMFFVHYDLYNAAAIFVLFVTMLWSIVFSLVGGLHSIPTDIKNAGQLFGLRGFSYIEKILLPASVPYLVTGSLLAWASGWNIVIVAEVLHTYIPGSTNSADLFGIGSVLVSASASGQQSTFLLAIVIMVTTIALINLFVWQRLLRYAETFKFE